MTTTTEREPLPRGFWVIWSTVALDMVGFGIVAPILGRYADRFGASGLQVGLLFASFSLAQMICAPMLGRLSDRVGRKPVIIVSLIGTAVGSFVTGIAGALWVLFVGRIIDGASGASIAVAQSAVVDLGKPEQRARMLGLLGMAFGVGFVVGPALGGLAALGPPRTVLRRFRSCRSKRDRRCHTSARDVHDGEAATISFAPRASGESIHRDRILLCASIRRI